MLKSEIKVHKSCSKSILDDILANNPGTNGKKFKKRLLGPLSRSKSCENGPEIVEKKIHCCT
jgi:hypothetical protein